MPTLNLHRKRLVFLAGLLLVGLPIGYPDAPRRMLYCLPMRVLVAQAVEHASKWISALKLSVGVATLMGGEVYADWELYPERRYLIARTQDMLFSRAVNRAIGLR